MTLLSSSPVPPRPLPAAAPRQGTGPFGQCTEGLRIGGTLMPSPLVSTEIAVTVRGFLATVTTRRRFRNAEATSIEATLTYPVPVDAVAHGLAVRIGERTLVGQAHAKGEARQRYEQAMDDGRTAILHEEPLKGVHILSVGQVPPGAEVIVESTWTKALAARGAAVLAIPMTVGEVYGRLPLDPGDDLVADGPRASAEVTVEAEQGRAVLCGEAIAPGARRIVPMDRHIVIAFDGIVPTPLTGTAAGGREVAMTIGPAPAGEAALDLVVLFDRSGSTSSPFSGNNFYSVHAAATDALRTALVQTFRERDRLVLWHFDDVAKRLGKANGRRAADLVRRIGPPGGGTEIGWAIEAAMSGEREPRDLLLITDGRSAAIDVHALAGRGWRISVVLCGPASLDALPGHLAALTGGQLVAVGGGGDQTADVIQAIETILGQLRSPRQPHAATNLPALPEHLVERRGGMEIEVAWSGARHIDAAIDAVGAYAAALALPLLERQAATDLAVAHGLVTHLTSLLVVDTEGPVQSTIPGQRKVPLPAPMAARTRSDIDPSPVSPQTCIAEVPLAAPPPVPKAAPPSAPTAAPEAGARSAPRLRWPKMPDLSRLYMREPPAAPRPVVVTLAAAAAAIDWRRDGPAIAEGRLDALPDWVREAIVAASRHPDIAEVARREGLDPIVLIVALMADADAAERTRARIARRIAHLPVPERRRLAASLGL